MDVKKCHIFLDLALGGTAATRQSCSGKGFPQCDSTEIEQSKLILLFQIEVYYRLYLYFRSYVFDDLRICI
jgi:hypothetical protein